MCIRDSPKALGIVGQATALAPTPAETFKGKLAMAQLCLNAGQYSLARSQLEGLTTQIAKHDLTVWNPYICIEVYAGLYASIRGMNDALRPKGDDIVDEDFEAIPPEELAAEREAFEVLCRLDPAVALKLGG